MYLPTLLLAMSLEVMALPPAAPPATSPAKSQGAERPYGIERRVLWTTSRVKGSPDPPAPYRTEPAFPQLRFEEPLALVSLPGTDRLVVAQRYGKIFSFRNDPRADRAELLLDAGKVVFGLAFHSHFINNGFLYVLHVPDRLKDQPRRMRVSRFEVSRTNPPRCDPRTEKVVYEWPSNGGHDGGCLVFGLDGFLYIGAGDGGVSATGQDLGDAAGSILRIDVDHPREGRGYGLPKDNPFVGVAGALPEIWAYGLRQPWRFSVDRESGALWVGDVGQDLWEMIYLIERGGNYGWNVTEGSHPYRPEQKRGPTPILPPIVEHSHAEARSITGGYVYRGTRLKDLVGAYIYGDYDTGKIWGLRYEGRRVVWHKELVDSDLRLVSFGEDARGELYLVDHMGGKIHRLAPNQTLATMADFPRKLSETGLFADVKELRPAPGLIPYSVNAPLWSDGASKERYLAIPGDGRIEFDAVAFPESPQGAGPFGWKFPDGTVLVKTFFLEMEKGNPATSRRLETRILHHERLVGTEEVGDQYWRGYTYLWDEDQTDAILLEDARGRDRTYTIRDRGLPGGERRQTWHFPSRTECSLCHTMPAKFVLGVNTLQMNKDHDYNGVVDNQIRTWEHLGLFTKPLPAPPERLPRLADPQDQRQSLDRRARAYLHANCAQCHRAFGGGNAEFQLIYTLDLAASGTIRAHPAQGDLGIPDARIIAPGDPRRSLIYHRMSVLGPGRMPPLASSVVDQEAVELIRDWIQQIPPKS